MDRLDYGIAYYQLGQIAYAAQNKKCKYDIVALPCSHLQNELGF